MHVFTYGSLMFPEVWRIVVGREFETVEGTFAGHSIFRVRDAAFPGIIAAAGECFVRGLVYLDVDAASVERLDRFEDDFYARRSLSIDCRDGRRREADAYTVPAKKPSRANSGAVDRRDIRLQRRVGRFHRAISRILAAGRRRAEVRPAACRCRKRSR